MSRITNDPSITHQWEIVGDVMVTRTGGEIPAALWDPFINAVVQRGVVQIFSLVVAPSTISAIQRKGAADTFKHQGVRALVVTDDRLTRGILTALSWLGADVKGFSWKDLDKALEHVDTTADVRARLRMIALRCGAEVAA